MCRTNVCVESTVRDAFTNSLYTLVVPDATATLTNEAHQTSLGTWHGSRTVRQLRRYSMHYQSIINDYHTSPA